MKNIVFVTGTRADYGKLKSIILKLEQNKNFKILVFVTGMHNLKIYGSTHDELRKDPF
jgi:UDP-N-acetylglucosamine 2-epimerase (hydrolysing)